VTSREKTKHPEGTEWYDERVDTLRAALAQLKYEEAPPPKWLDKNWRVTPNALPQVGFDSTLAALWAAKAESAKAKESKHE
jgi:hypothetical protein